MKHLLLPLSALLLAACASAPGDENRIRGVAQFAEDVRLGEQVSKICFASRIDGFGQTTRDTVIVEEGRDHYLIETHGTCFNLKNAHRIGVKNSSSICLRSGDRLLVSDSMFDVRSRLDFSSCTIKSIYRWAPKAQPAPKADDEG